MGRDESERVYDPGKPRHKEALREQLRSCAVCRLIPWPHRLRLPESPLRTGSTQDCLVSPKAAVHGMLTHTNMDISSSESSKQPGAVL